MIFVSSSKIVRWFSRPSWSRKNWI